MGGYTGEGRREGEICIGFNLFPPKSHSRVLQGSLCMWLHSKSRTAKIFRFVFLLNHANLNQQNFWNGMFFPSFKAKHIFHFMCTLNFELNQLISKCDGKSASLLWLPILSLTLPSKPLIWLDGCSQGSSCFCSFFPQSLFLFLDSRVISCQTAYGLANYMAFIISLILQPNHVFQFSV